MPPMLGSPLVQIEGLDHQARLLNTAMGNSLAMSTAAPTLSPAHSPGAPQSSVAASAQSLPLPRQPYPPNIIPYAHYLPPFFMPPTLQYLGHGGFPPQFPTGNMYLPAAAAASGMKVAPAYKQGSDVMSQTPTGAFGGVYVSPEVGYNPSAAAQTSGSSNASQDLLKESNNVYLGQQQQCEGTTVHSTSMPVNPFFNLPPQMGPGAFSPVYHPLQTVAAQQPVDAMAALPELVDPTSFHQQQQMNWNNGGGF